jgi:hypothetical protein
VTRAKARAAAAGAPATFRHADVAREALTGSYSLIVDIGCLHNLQRPALATALSTIDDVAATGATLLTFAFEPGGPRPGPVGFTGPDLKTMLPGWDLIASRHAPETELKARMRKARPHYYTMVKAAKRPG